jgi:hypothetical protein
VAGYVDVRVSLGIQGSRKGTVRLPNPPPEPFFFVDLAAHPRPWFDLERGYIRWWPLKYRRVDKADGTYRYELYEGTNDPLHFRHNYLPDWRT